MPKITAFTLIELIVVIVLIGFMMYLAIPHFQQIIKLSQIKDLTYPSGDVYVFQDHKAILVKNRKEIPIDLDTSDIQVYGFVDNKLQPKTFLPYHNHKVIFAYHQKDGVGDLMVVKQHDKFILFKPLWIAYIDNLHQAQRCIKEYY
ncbi:MAG: type II secretion system protein [Epsilonproteobacteria bacterium]|nr:type II secretion system protein [Campylobacterota bacterium]